MKEINPLTDLHAERVSKEIGQGLLIALGLFALAALAAYIYIQSRRRNDPKDKTNQVSQDD